MCLNVIDSGKLLTSRQNFVGDLNSNFLSENSKYRILLVFDIKKNKYEYYLTLLKRSMGILSVFTCMGKFLSMNGSI